MELTALNLTRSYDIVVDQRETGFELTFKTSDLKDAFCVLLNNEEVKYSTRAHKPHGLFIHFNDLDSPSDFNSDIKRWGDNNSLQLLIKRSY